MRDDRYKEWRGAQYIAWYADRLEMLEIPRYYQTIAQWVKIHRTQGLAKILNIVNKAHSKRIRTPYLDYIRERTLFEKVKSWGRGGGTGFIDKRVPSNAFSEKFMIAYDYPEYMTLGDFCNKQQHCRTRFKELLRYLSEDSYKTVAYRNKTWELIKADVKKNLEEIICAYLKKKYKKAYVVLHPLYKKFHISRQGVQQQILAGKIKGVKFLRNKYYVPEGTVLVNTKRLMLIK